jgi:hypothetical protein
VPASAAAAPASPHQAARFIEQLRQTAAAHGNRAIDVTRLPFKMIFEVKASEGAMSRLLAPFGWSVSSLASNYAYSGGDCSHAGDGGGTSFVRLHSPELTLDKHGLDNLGQVIDALKDKGVELGHTSAMRILVPQDRLREGDTVSNLVGLHLSYEDMLYRLGQGGWEGRALRHKVSGSEAFVEPMSGVANFVQQPASKWEKSLNRRRGAMNSATEGQWEFRWFDSSLQKSAVQANVCLLLGMIGAASDGHGTFTEPHTHREYNNEVPRARWSSFLDATVGHGPLGQQLARQFEAAGGRLELALDPRAEHAVDQLLSRGWSLRADEHRIDSGAALAEHVSGARKIMLEAADGKRWELDPQHAPDFVLGSVGELAALPPSLQAATADASRLIEAGASLRNPRDQLLSPFEAAFEVSRASAVTLRQGSFSLSLGASQTPPGASLPPPGSMPLHRVAAMPASDLQAATSLSLRLDRPLDSPAAAAHWMQVMRGCTFSDSQGERLGAVAAQEPTVDLRFPSGLRARLTAQDLLSTARLMSGSPDDSERVRNLLAEVEACQQATGATFHADGVDGELQTPAEKFAAIVGGVGLHLCDPLGTRYDSHGEAQFTQLHASLKKVQADLTAQHQIILKHVFNMLDGEVEGRATLNDGRTVPVYNAYHIPWVFAQHGMLHIAEPGARGNPAVGVMLDSWQGLEQFYGLERRQGLTEEQAHVLEQADRLGHHGVRFYYPGTKQQIELNSALTQRLSEGGVMARLPHFKFWRGWFHKKIAVQGTEQLDKLATKFS